MSQRTYRNGGPPPLPTPPALAASRPHGAWRRARRAAVELTAEVIEQIAERVAELLHERGGKDERADVPHAGLLDPAELARHLGVTRAWVYQHAGELGAIRIGSGPRARIRFDLEVAREALAGPDGQPSPTTLRRRRPRRQPVYRPDPTVPLLPVPPRRVRGGVWRIRRARSIRGR